LGRWGRGEHELNIVWRREGLGKIVIQTEGTIKVLSIKKEMPESRKTLHKKGSDTPIEQSLRETEKAMDE